MEIVGSTGQTVYHDVVHHVLAHGEERSPRGISTLDAGFTSVLLASPYDALPTGTGRGLREAIAAAEALQLIAGTSRPNLMLRIAPKFREYAEDSGEFHGAYGNRISDQMIHVVRKLRNDRDTRQAVVTLWDPDKDNRTMRRDYPCTIALQFEIVNSMLYMNTIMRSNDVWLGTPYDFFQFTQLQLTLAHVLNVQPGTYRHTALSMHAYARDFDNLRNVHLPANYPKPQPHGLETSDGKWATVEARARQLLQGVPEDLTDSEAWYCEALSPYYQ